MLDEKITLTLTLTLTRKKKKIWKNQFEKQFKFTKNKEF